MPRPVQTAQHRLWRQVRPFDQADQPYLAVLAHRLHPARQGPPQGLRGPQCLEAPEDREDREDQLLL
jgi:hypothetical protein